MNPNIWFQLRSWGCCVTERRITAKKAMKIGSCHLSRAARLAAKPKRALGVQTRRSAAKAASAATKTTKRTDSMERPASELMDSISESLDIGMEETGVRQSPPAISHIEEHEEEEKEDHPVFSTTITTTVSPSEAFPLAMQGPSRNVQDTQASSYLDSTSSRMSSFVPTISTNNIVSDFISSAPASLSSASMNTTQPDFDS